MISRKQIRLGEIYVLLQDVFYGFFPVIIHYAVERVPAIFFAGISTLVAAFCLLGYEIVTGNIRYMLHKKALLYVLGVAVFIVIIPSLFIFEGTRYTSGLNTSILLQAEIFSAFLICRIYCREKITAQKILGVLFMLIGATLVLYNGHFALNKGDLLIIAGVSFYPIGDIFSKKAMKLIPETMVLFMRSLFGGTALLIMSFLFERTWPSFFTITFQNLWPILLSGILVMFISKIFWYEGLKRIEISEAVALGIPAPVFGFLYTIIFLKEIPTLYHVVGLMSIIIGVIIITKKITHHREHHHGHR